MDDSILENVAYELLQEYIENGRQDTMPEEMVHYLNLLEVVRGQIHRNKSRRFVINLLKASPYNHSEYLAGKLYTDAINFFYIQEDIKKEAYRNLYAEKLEKAAAFVLNVMKTVKDLDTYAKLIKEAALLRGLHEPDKEELPEELFQKPIKVFTQNPTKLGIPAIDRQRLAREIDSWDIEETEKARLKREASIDQPKLYLDHGLQQAE
jgi:hypothetical protein